MAKFGAKRPVFVPYNDDGTLGDMLEIGKMVRADFAVNLASGDLYADDSLAETVSEFASGNLTLETDDMLDEVAAVVYGCAVTNQTVHYNKEDNEPYGRLAYYKVRLLKNVRSYVCYYYPKVKAAIGNDNVTTRGSSVTFQTTTTVFTILTDDAGDWRLTKEFSAEADAEAWCDTMVTTP